MISTSSIKEFLALPFPTLQKDVDTLLSEKARTELDLPLSATAHTVPYFKILHAWRLRHSDYKGAAAILVERLEARRQRQAAPTGRAGVMHSGKKDVETALDEYLVGINALAMAGGKEEEGWMFVEGGGRERRVVTLGDLRERYQTEMDRMGDIEAGNFGFMEELTVDKDEDVVEEQDVEMEG